MVITPSNEYEEDNEISNPDLKIANWENHSILQNMHQWQKYLKQWGICK